MRSFTALLLALILFSLHPTKAQEATPVPDSSSGIDVQVEAEDGKTLYGSYFAKDSGDAQAVLLIHQLYTNRSSWNDLVPSLLDAGFKVLAIDLRGYGKTRGRINWTEAQKDTVVWANWLKAQSGVQSITVMGSSMGSNLALVGCASIEGCVGAVAISPSLNYFGVATDQAMGADFPSLIVYADNDRYPKQDVPKMLELGGDHVSTIVYSGRTHGMDLFDEHDDLAGQLISWIQNR